MVIRFCTTAFVLAIAIGYSISSYAHKKIYLLRDTMRNDGAFFISDNPPFKFVNPADSNYIMFTSSSDMGETWYDYRIRSTAPTDSYTVYVNGKVDETGHITNGYRDGKWTFYSKDGSYSTCFYHHFTNYGLHEDYDAEGNLIKYNYVDTLYGNTIKTELHKNGMIASNTIWVASRRLAGEYFDSNGRLEYIHHSDAKNPMTGGITQYKNGITNGKARREYKSGTFELVYEQNKIISWTYYDSSLNKITTVFPPESK